MRNLVCVWLGRDHFHTKLMRQARDACMHAFVYVCVCGGGEPPTEDGGRLWVGRKWEKGCINSRSVTQVRLKLRANGLVWKTAYIGNRFCENKQTCHAGFGLFPLSLFREVKNFCFRCIYKHLDDLISEKQISISDTILINVSLAKPDSLQIFSAGSRCLSLLNPVVCAHKHKQAN